MSAKTQVIEKSTKGNMENPARWANLESRTSHMVIYATIGHV